MAFRGFLGAAAAFFGLAAAGTFLGLGSFGSLGSVAFLARLAAGFLAGALAFVLAGASVMLSSLSGKKKNQEKVAIYKDLLIKVNKDLLIDF